MVPKEKLHEPDSIKGGGVWLRQKECCQNEINLCEAQKSSSKDDKTFVVSLFIIILAENKSIEKKLI